MRSKEKRPVVLLIGWLHSKAKHVQKYAQFYNMEGMHTISLTPRVGHVLNVPEAERLARALQDLLHQEHMVERPVVVHGFSVGGYLYGQYLHQLQRCGLLHTDAGADASAAAASKPLSKIAGQVYDSPVDFDGIPFGISRAVTQNPLLQRSIQGAISLFLALRPTNRAAYTASANLFKANPFSTPTHIFYSHSDPVCDVDRIESVMEAMRQRGVAVSSSEYHDTDHVQVLFFFFSHTFLHTFLTQFLVCSKFFFSPTAHAALSRRVFCGLAHLPAPGAERTLRRHPRHGSMTLKKSIFTRSCLG